MHNAKAEVTYDILAQRGGAQLYSKLGFLFESVKDGDGPPTQGVMEVFVECTRELQQHEGELRSLLVGDLAKLNDDAKKLDIPNVIVPTTTSEKATGK